MDHEHIATWMTKHPILTIVGLIVVLVVISNVLGGEGSGSRRSPDRDAPDVTTDMTSGDREALRGYEQRIEGTDDCEELQVIFDASADAHERFGDESPPNLSKMKMHTGIIEAADERMRAVGCY